MIQIIDENRQPSSSERLLKALSGGLAGAARGLEPYAEKKKQRLALEKSESQLSEQQKALEKLMGKEEGSLKGLRDPALMKELLSGELQKGRDQNKFAHETDLAGLKETKETREKLAPLQSGLQTIQRMREIGQTNHLGAGSFLQSIVNPDIRKDRGEYEQLGKSLISLASTIPIRNQREFETLSKNLFDPNLTDATREGILDAMERIISQSMQQFSPQDSQEQKEPSKIKPKMDSFWVK